MGKPAPPKFVKIFVGLLTSRLSLIPQISKSLERTLGPIDYSSELVDFTFTRYYEAEMGSSLKKQFLSFERLASPEKLAGIKLFTNRLEDEWLEGERRLVNLDPGYLNEARLVLASTKDFAHRIYIGQGIYGEITLLFHPRGFEPLPWTYPDFRSEVLHEVFRTIRANYMQQIKSKINTLDH